MVHNRQIAKQTDEWTDGQTEKTEKKTQRWVSHLINLN